MKILIIGKYPPIQGGVSARTFRFAHALAGAGHAVNVVTSAAEVTPPFRMKMRDEDWARCDGDYGTGSVRVHWTDPPDRSQFHIPENSAVVTKLTSIGIDIVDRSGADVVLSFYAEPYAVAGHLIAEATALPHVIRTAGSDAGRLWRHSQFKTLYDYIFRSAALLSPGIAVARQLKAIGIADERLRVIPAYTIDTEVFSPEGPLLDVSDLLVSARSDPAYAPLCFGEMRSDIPYLGIYGKLGLNKGTEELLRAIGRLKDRGKDTGLLIMGHSRPAMAEGVHRLIADLGLGDQIVQLPFLPNWRVPEFIRRCLAICYLEQDFPIHFHAPIVVREVMACGACLVASTEVLRKAPFSRCLVHGYNCIAIDDVKDIDELADKLANIIGFPDPIADIGLRARQAILSYQEDLPFPQVLERALADAIALGRPPTAIPSNRSRLIVERPDAPSSSSAGLKQETQPPDLPELQDDPLFRLNIAGWALQDEEIKNLIPSPMVELRLTWNRSEKGPPKAASAPSKSAPTNIERMEVDGLTVAVVRLCDGKRTVENISEAIHEAVGANEGQRRPVFERVIELFEKGLLRLDSP